MSTVKQEPSPALSPTATTTSTATTTTTTAAPASDEKYWLVRVPSFVMSEFKNMSRAPGARLGSIVIDRNTTTTSTSSHSTQPGVKQETAFPHMRLIVDSPDPSIPRECNLHVRPKKRSMLVFADRGEPDRCKLQSVVEIVADANPVDGQAYRNWLAKRLERSTIKTHVAKKIDESQQSTKLLPHAIHAQQQVGKKQKVESRERRVASHASQVEDMVYRAFDKKPYWTLKELLKETNQPKPALLNVLNELCDRESKGDLIHNFKLKPQYRVHSDSAAAAAAAAPMST